MELDKSSKQAGRSKEGRSEEGRQAGSLVSNTVVAGSNSSINAAANC